MQRQVGVGVGGRTQGPPAPPGPAAQGTPMGEGGPPGWPTGSRTWPPMSPSLMCGGGGRYGLGPGPGVPPYCHPQRGAECAPSTPSPPAHTGGPHSPPALPSSVAINLPGTGNGKRGPPSEGAEAGGSTTSAPLRWRKLGSARASRGSSGGAWRPGSSRPSSPFSPGRSRMGRRSRPGIVQHRLQQLQEVHGAHHHELHEVRGDQGEQHHLHRQADHQLQAGMHHVHHGRREEENKTETNDKIKLNFGEAREERGPPCTYLDSRRDRSSSPSPSSRPPQGATTSPRTKEDKCKGQGEEDIKKKEETERN